MSDQTPRTRLPVIPDNDAQPTVLHNEALVQLDALLYARILDRDLTAPPAGPADGDTYLVKATATGLWTGQGGKLAAALDGAWRFYPPFTGLSLYVADEQKLIVFDGSTWQDYAAILDLQNVPLLGLNTTADTTNRLAVKSAALLFDNTGAGIQAKLNKHAAGDTASLLYQTNYSGRTEFGLTGDDDFHLKVSPDGAAWTEALRIAAANGYVGLGCAPLAPFHAHVGATAPAAALLNAADVAYFTGEKQANITVVAASSTSVSSSYALIGRRARGSLASPAACSTGDRVFAFLSGVYNGSTVPNTAGIEFFVDGATVSGSASPQRIQIATGAGTGRFARIWVGSEGNVAIGQNVTAAGVCQLDVDGPVRVKSYTVAGLPAASAGAGQVIYVSDESGGAVLAFSDGTAWRRVTDRAVVS